MATSLEKSHSKSSNAKLTLICFLLSLSFVGFWLGLFLAFAIESLLVVGIIVSVVSLLLLVLSLHIIGKFTR